MSYLDVIRKEYNLNIRTYQDDVKARKDKDYFRPNGTQVYCGKQGSGKTISAVRHANRIKDLYPKAVLVSNLDLKYYQPIDFSSEQQLKEIVQQLNHNRNLCSKYYIRFKSLEELSQALVLINNEKYGVIYLIDEIHTYFNSLDSKNIPMFVFTEISQQRKQRKVIVGTSQLFLRMAKPFREQCDNLIVCNTIFGVLTIQRVYDGMELEQEYDGKLIGHMRKMGWFWHTRSLRDSFDTYQKVVSGAEQYDHIVRYEIKDKSIAKKITVR